VRLRQSISKNFPLIKLSPKNTPFILMSLCVSDELLVVVAGETADHRQLALVLSTIPRVSNSHDPMNVLEVWVSIFLPIFAACPFREN
jgi:hypothetical protein